MVVQPEETRPMINEGALRDTLLSMASNSRMLYVALTSALNEVAALRETVRGLDPTFADVMEERRQQEAQKTADIVQGIIDGYDLIIEKLKEGYVC